MRKKGIILAVSVLLVLGLLIAGCAKTPTTTTPAATTPTATTPKPTTPMATTPKTTAPSPTQAEVIKWKGQTYVASTPNFGPFNIEKYPYLGEVGGAFYWRDWIQEASNGRLEMDIAPAASIVPNPDMLQAVRDGVLDVCFQYPGYYTGFMPEANIEMGLPGGPSSIEEEWDWLYRWGLDNEFKQIYAEHNIYVITYVCGTPMGLGTSFPIDDLSSIKGKKVRATGSLADWVQLLGATPVPVPYAELYMALKLGTVDGWVSGLTVLEEAKLKEVTTHWMLSPVAGPPLLNIMINRDALDELPEDIRDLIYNYSAGVIYSKKTTPLETSYIKSQPYCTYVYLSEEEAAWVTEQAVEQIWTKIAGLSPRCAKLIEMSKDWMRAFGKIE